MGIPVSKVKTLLHQTFCKLDADNRNEAVLLAVQQGYLDIDNLLSLDELAEILCTLHPIVLKRIANLVRNKKTPESLSNPQKQLVCVGTLPEGILTNRERDVLIMVRYGLTNKEIAEKLFITTSAVRTFLNRAFSKLNARKRADALQLALKQKEINIDEITTFEELFHFLSPMGVEYIEKLTHQIEENLKKEPT